MGAPRIQLCCGNEKPVTGLPPGPPWRGKLVFRAKTNEQPQGRPEMCVAGYDDQVLKIKLYGTGIQIQVYT